MKYGVSIKWLAVSSFEICCNGLHVVTDPYITECAYTDLTWEDVENCHMICLSHAHWDHITDIPRLVKKFDPRILCGDQTAMPMARWLNCRPSRIYPMHHNLELDFDSVKIKALYGRHTDLHNGFHDECEILNTRPICQEDPGIAALQPVGSFEYRNYLLTLQNGTKILFWGNDPTVEQRNLCKALRPDIAILQRSVQPEDIAQKAEFAASIGCKVVIPHHQDFKAVDNPAVIEQFREAFLHRVPDGEFLIPEHGKWMEL